MKFKKILKRLFLRHSKYYDTCKVLPLKIFCEIVNTNDYHLLALNKGFADPEKELEIWTNIIIEYSELEGDTTAKDRFEKVQTLNELKNSYTVIKAMIRFLWICPPDNEKYSKNVDSIIKDLIKMGYKIDTTNSEKYKKSIVAADQKANAIITFIRMKQNELQDNREEQDISFDELMAMIQSHYSVDDNLTVSRYISMKKSIMSRHKANDNITRGRKNAV
jgi:cell fate (sporulation/competence/biofilm development) regulator YlbF (YheA/YmcA/DUF963 family)